MGRHSSPDQGPFYRSFLGWVGLWLMIAAVTGIGVWSLVAAIGGPDARRSVAAEAPPKDERSRPDRPAPTVSGARIATATPEIATPEIATPSPSPPKREKKPALVTDGVTVQVLNGTLEDAAAQALADKLGGLGYSVVAVEESSRLYSETTVFWSTESSRQPAQALADRFGWIAQPKPANLSTGVSLHVVVGADET